MQLNDRTLADERPGQVPSGFLIGQPGPAAFQCLTTRAGKEMMQPCLIYLHVISLVVLKADRPCRPVALQGGDQRPVVLSMLAVALGEGFLLAPACAYCAITDPELATRSSTPTGFTPWLIPVALAVSAAHWAALLVRDPVYLYSDPFRPSAGFPTLVFMTRFCEVGSRCLLVAVVLALSAGWSQVGAMAVLLLGETCVLCSVIGMVDEMLGLGHVEQCIWWFVAFANPDYSEKSRDLLRVLPIMLCHVNHRRLTAAIVGIFQRPTRPRACLTSPPRSSRASRPSDSRRLQQSWVAGISSQTMKTPQDRRQPLPPPRWRHHPGSDWRW